MMQKNKPVKAVETKDRREPSDAKKNQIVCRNSVFLPKGFERCAARVLTSVFLHLEWCSGTYRLPLAPSWLRGPRPKRTATAPLPPSLLHHRWQTRQPRKKASVSHRGTAESPRSSDLPT